MENLSEQSSFLITNSEFNEIFKIISTKTDLIKKIKNQRKKLTKLELSQPFLLELENKLKKSEKSNIETLSQIKKELGEKLHKNSKTKQVVHAYSTLDQRQGKILDLHD